MYDNRLVQLNGRTRFKFMNLPTVLGPVRGRCPNILNELVKGNNRVSIFDRTLCYYILSEIAAIADKTMFAVR